MTDFNNTYFIKLNYKWMEKIAEMSYSELLQLNKKIVNAKIQLDKEFCRRIKENGK